MERVPSMPGNRASRHCLSLIQSLLLDVSPDTEFLAELADNLRVELNRLTPELIELLLADNVSGYNDQGRE